MAAAIDIFVGRHQEIDALRAAADAARAGGGRRAAGDWH